MKSIKSKFIKSMLLFVLVFSLLPLHAFADNEDTSVQTETAEESVQAESTEGSVQAEEGADASALPAEEPAATSEAAPAENSVTEPAQPADTNSSTATNEPAAQESAAQESAPAQTESSVPAAEESANSEAAAADESKAAAENSEYDTTNMYTYTFTSSSLSQQIQLNITYVRDNDGDGELDEPAILLISPYGDTFAIAKDSDMLESHEISATFSREPGLLKVNISKAFIGMWLVKTEYPVSLIATDPTAAESSTPQTEESSAAQEPEKTTPGFKMDASQLKAIGALVLLIAVFTAFMIFMKKKVKKAEAEQGANDKKSGKKPKTTKGKKIKGTPTVDDVEQFLTEEEIKEKELEKTKKELYDKFLDPKLYENKKEKVTKSEEPVKKKEEPKDMIVTLEDIDNDETILDYYKGTGDSDIVKAKEVVKVRQSFFPDNRFGD